MTRPDIVVVGGGLRGASQLTLEAVEVLRTARVVFHSPYTSGLAERVRDLNPDAVLIDVERGRYQPGTYRPEMYREMAADVLAEAACGSGVVLVQPGSAVVVDTVTQEVLRGAADAGLTAAVVPGVSAVEAVLARLGVDLAGGVQVVLAQELMLSRRVLDPTMMALVLQPGCVDSRWWYGAARSTPGRFGPLRDQLCRSWPTDTPAALVLAPVDDAHEGLTFWFRLGELDRLRGILSPFHTLFVPATASPPVDEDVAALLDDPVAAVHTLERDAAGRPVLAGPTEWFAPQPEVLDPDLLEDAARLMAWWERHRQMG